MPKINNIEFLTLPQQVMKNKRDVATLKTAAKGDKGDTGPQGPKGDKGDRGERGLAGAGNGIGFTPFTMTNPYETSSLGLAICLYILPSGYGSCRVTFGGTKHSMHNAVLIVLVNDTAGDKHLLVMDDDGETSMIEEDGYSDYIKVEGHGLVISFG